MYDTFLVDLEVAKVTLWVLPTLAPWMKATLSTYAKLTFPMTLHHEMIIFALWLQYGVGLLWPPAKKR